MTDKAPALILVDGSSYLFRAFHALPQLMTTKNHPTGAIKGVISMILRLQKDYPEAKIVVVFDAKGKTFRHDMYKEYKAHRPPMPEDLAVQIQPIHDIIKALGLPLLVVEGVEADDVIGTLATQASNQAHPTLISTGDKDMAQLVNEHVTLLNTMTGKFLDPAGVEEQFGIPPRCIIDYLTLVGDSVDNIPGVPKVGPKTAVKWLQEYGSLDGIVEHAEDIGGKIGENLRDSLDQLPLSHQLATIKLDVENSPRPEDIHPAEPDKTRLLELYKEFEFKSWVEELLADGDRPASEDSAKDKPPTEYDCVLTEEALNDWINQARKSSLVAVDTETTSLNYMEARVVGVSLAVTPGKAAYIPFGHDYLDAPKQLAEDLVLAKLKPLLEDPDLLKVGQNLKYDKNVLAQHGITLKGIAHDTMLESYVSNSTSRHDMDSLALQHLSHTTTHFEDIAGKGAKQLTFNQIELEKASHYAAEDADITLRLHQTLFPKLQQEDSLLSVYRDIEMPLVPVLSRMERRGVLVAAQKLRTQSSELAKRLMQLEKEAYVLAGEEFNLGSPKQLQSIFYEKLELPILKKTPKGQPSTAEPVLQELAHDYPLPRLILEHRSLSKLKSTYTDKLPLQINQKTGRIHTSYHQAVAATGRLSSTDPNLQNIPVRTEEGRRIRQAFIAPDGYRLLAADYSQIELRIMAHLSQDSGLLTAFEEGKDIHRATAAEVFGTDLESVSSEQRRSAKAINFGLIYGMSAFGLSRQLGIARKQAQQYIDRYFDRYPGVLEYMNRIRQQAAQKGFVETLYGRRLYLPDINSRNQVQRQAAERTAINAPMQGTAADIIKRAMVAVDQWLFSSSLPASMVMQVHDELVLEVAESAVGEVQTKLNQLMSGAADLAIPLIVDTGCGLNWDEAH